VSKDFQSKTGLKVKEGLNLKTLDALMRTFLNVLEVDAMNWNAIYDIWKVDTKTKKRRP
jgi:hypothetical protein